MGGRTSVVGVAVAVVGVIVVMVVVSGGGIGFGGGNARILDPADPGDDAHDDGEGEQADRGGDDRLVEGDVLGLGNELAGGFLAQIGLVVVAVIILAGGSGGMGLGQDGGGVIAQVTRASPAEDESCDDRQRSASKLLHGGTV